ncbi:MAG: hypothetical protein AB7U20_21350 [Planctomycetaceae bacterium]
MSEMTPLGYVLKKMLKEAVAETLQEKRFLFYEIFAEVVEDFARAAAIREGQESEPIDRKEFVRPLRVNP